MIAAYFTLAISVGLVVCHRYNGDEWDYFFGTVFFAGIPFAGLLQDGFALALWGFNLGAMMLIGLTLFAYLLQYQQTGEWKAGV